MLKTFEEVSAWIGEGRVLHIAGTETLLRKMPKGNWIGGSTEYFLTDDGGLVSDSMLFVTELPKGEFSIRDYDHGTICQMPGQAYDNGFAIVIIPFDSDVHKEYSRNAPEYEGMFIKNIVGWISGVNLDKTGQTPVVVNGQTGQTYTDRAVVLHLEVPESKTVSVGIVNIHKQDADSPVIEFEQNSSYSVSTCKIDGKETLLANYIRERGHDMSAPLVADYFGHGVNVSFRAVEGDTVHFYSPVLSGIRYRFAKAVPDYAAEFQQQLNRIKESDGVFSCNCILNFLFGELEGKKFGGFYGPATFGEVAFQLLNQTLVYVTVK